MNLKLLIDIKLYLEEFIESKYFLIVVLILVFAFIIFLIYYIKIINKRNQIKKNIKRIYFKRMYIIDLNNNHVTYFNTLNSSDIKTIEIDEFYSSINKSDLDDFKTWINELKDGHIFSNEKLIRNIKLSNSLICYRFIKNDENNNRIYLESDLFNNLSYDIMTRGLTSSILDEDSLITYYNGLKPVVKKKNGLAIYYINIFNDLENSANDNSNAFYLLLKLLNAIAPSMKKSQYCYFVNHKNLCIVDLKEKKKNNVKQFAELINVILNKLIYYESFKNIFDYRIGIIYEPNYKNVDLKSKIRLALDYSVYAKNMNNDTKVCFYNKTINLNNSYHSMIIEDLNRVLKYNSIENLYEPIVDIKTGRVRAYLQSISFSSSTVNDFHFFEHEIYSQGKQSEYLNLIINKACETLERSQKKVKLFIPLYLPFLKSLKNINRTSETSINSIIYVINDYVLKEWLKYNENVENLLMRANEEGYILALKIHNLNNVKEDYLLKYFSYFIYDEKFMLNTKNNKFDRILLYEFILKHNKQFNISLGIDSWSGIELLINTGIDFIAGSIISKPSKDFEEVSKKTTSTISDINMK